jgi:hypothetical protein
MYILQFVYIYYLYILYIYIHYIFLYIIYIYITICNTIYSIDSNIYIYIYTIDSITKKPIKLKYNVQILKKQIYTTVIYVLLY